MLLMAATLATLLGSAFLPIAEEAAGAQRKGADTWPAWVNLKIGNRDCYDCLSRVREALVEMVGVTAVSIRLDEPIVAVRYEPSYVRPVKLVAALRMLGFEASLAGMAAEAAGSRSAKGDQGLGPTRVYTNDDLPKRSGRAERQPATAKDQDAEATVRDLLERQAELERVWRARFADAHERLRQAEKNGWRLVTRIVLVGGGTGMGGTGRGVAFPVPMKVWEFSETDAVRQAREAVDGLEEELRKAGLPPGWSRE